MATINISLPKEQVNLVDKLTNAYGFTSRSEFIRSLFRFIAYRPTLLRESTVFPFVSPKEKSVNKIIDGFKKTEKYSPSFIKDLKKGLEMSDYFKK